MQLYIHNQYWQDLPELNTLLYLKLRHDFYSMILQYIYNMVHYNTMWHKTVKLCARDKYKLILTLNSLAMTNTNIEFTIEVLAHPIQLNTVASTLHCLHLLLLHLYKVIHVSNFLLKVVQIFYCTCI